MPAEIIAKFIVHNNNLQFHMQFRIAEKAVLPYDFTKVNC